MSGKLIVPTDITVMEESLTHGKRRIRPLERIGLMCVPPIWHVRYNKMDSKDLRAVLRRKYDPNNLTEENALVIARQESVRKRVAAEPFMWGTVAVACVIPFWSFRKYDYKLRAITIPFLAYGGSIFGRCLGDWATGRWQEYKRNRFLGDLPAKCYYNAPQPAAE